MKASTPFPADYAAFCLQFPPGSRPSRPRARRRKFPLFRHVDGQRVMVCRECGCDDLHACPGGCYWLEAHLCSACAPDRAARLDSTGRGRRECQDRTVGRHGADKTARIDLGLALLQRVALPGICYTRQEIAAWAGCTDAAILLIERKAMRKVREALGRGDDLRAIRREFADHLDSRTVGRAGVAHYLRRAA